MPSRLLLIIKIKCVSHKKYIFRSTPTHNLIMACDSQMPMAIAESYFSGSRKSSFVSAGSHIPTASRLQEWRQFASGLYGWMIPEWKLSNAIIILAGALKVYNATKPVRVHNAVCSLLSSVTAYRSGTALTYLYT